MTSNPKALEQAQDDSEPFEVMEIPPTNFDLFDSKPISTGIVMGRKLVHQQKDWHSSVHIWIVDVQCHLILLQKRSPLKDTFPNRWDISAAGHIPANAETISTARAELEEELGLSVTKDEEFQFQFICPAEQAPLGGCNCYEHVFFLKRESSNLKCALGTKEVTEVKWVSIENLKLAWKLYDTEYVPRVKIYRDAFFKCLDKILVEQKVE
jgi:isopentenyldiphosphate isomerase